MTGYYVIHLLTQSVTTEALVSNHVTMETSCVHSRGQSCEVPAVTLH